MSLCFGALLASGLLSACAPAAPLVPTPDTSPTVAAGQPHRGSSHGSTALAHLRRRRPVHNQASWFVRRSSGYHKVGRTRLTDLPRISTAPTGWPRKRACSTRSTRPGRPQSATWSCQDDSPPTLMGTPLSAPRSCSDFKLAAASLPARPRAPEPRDVCVTCFHNRSRQTALLTSLS